MISEAFINELKGRCDIEGVVSSYVHLNRRGRLLTGLCPFHNEKSPSFTVYSDSQSFYCFGCGAGGDVISFIRRIENLDYPEAVAFVAQRAGLSMPDSGEDKQLSALRLKILELNRHAARFFYDVLVSKEGAQGLRYLKERGLQDNTIRRFGIGFAPDSFGSLAEHLKGLGYQPDEIIAARLCSAGKKSTGCYDLFRDRVMFPIIDLRGNVIAFGGRRLHEQGPKYLNSSDTMVFKKSKNLFALNRAKNSQHKGLILAEGYMDVVSLHQAGFDNAVATLGTSLTSEQTALLNKYADEVIIAYDSDEAGQSAARRAISLFSEVGLRARVLKMEGAKDPDEYIKKFGNTRFKMLLENSKGAVEFEISKLRERYNPEIPEEKVRFLTDFAALMASVPSPIERDVYIKKVCAEVSASPEAILTEIGRRIKRGRRSSELKQQRDLKPQVGAKGRERDPQRGRYLKSAIAEERLILVLVKNPDYLQSIDKRIAPADFLVDYNREVYGRIRERILNGLPVDMMSLSAVLDIDEMAFVSSLLAGEVQERHSAAETNDYIDTILSEKNKKAGKEVAAMDDSDFSSYLSGIAAAKKSKGK